MRRCANQACGHRLPADAAVHRRYCDRACQVAARTTGERHIAVPLAPRVAAELERLAALEGMTLPQFAAFILTDETA